MENAETIGLWHRSRGVPAQITPQSTTFTRPSGYTNNSPMPAVRQGRVGVYLPPARVRAEAPSYSARPRAPPILTPPVTPTEDLMDSRALVAVDSDDDAFTNVGVIRRARGWSPLFGCETSPSHFTLALGRTSANVLYF
jgi:hypothetical protein